MTFYVLRYLPDVPLNKRKHALTLGRYATFGEAEDAREDSPARDLLDTSRRETCTGCGVTYTTLTDHRCPTQETS